MVRIPHRLGIALFAIGASVAAVAAALIFQPIMQKLFAVQLISPLPTWRLAAAPTLHGQDNQQESEKIIFGFLPYWNNKYEPSIRYSQLTHIAFFGLDVNKSGSVNKKAKDGYEEPGWTAYQSSLFGTIVRKAHSNGAHVVLVLRAFDNATIESVLLQEKNQKRLVQETVDIITSRGLDGVNVDFEYVDAPPPNVRRQFTTFVQRMRQELGASRHLSVDMYANAINNDLLWDIPALSEIVDHIVVMAYDFTRPSSDYSGPVAPLHSIKESISAYSKKVTLSKLLLGIPYYGYEWPTYSKEPISKTRDVGYIATYKRVQELILGASAKTGWDEKSFTPYVISTESGQTTQIFYDDLRSLGLKYDFVNDSNLGGIAIWALGYDTPRPELWKLLEEKFK